jgi:hypothetical protein
MKFAAGVRLKKQTNEEVCMGQFTKGADMTVAQKLLLESLAGHIALLESAYPRKAKCIATRRAKQCVISKLRSCNRMRLAA